MARPTSLYNFVSPEFNSIYDSLIKKQLQSGVKDAGTRQIIVMRFLMDAMNEIGNLYEDEDGDPMSTKQIVKELGYPTNHSGYKAAFRAFLQQHTNVANSQELKAIALDPDKIEAFKRNAGFSNEESSDENGGSQLTSNRRTGADRVSKELTGQGIVGNENLRSELRDIVLNMNKEMAVRKSRMTRTGKSEAPIVVTDTPNQSYAKTILSALEELKYGKDDVMQKIKSNQIDEYDMDEEATVLAKVPSAIVDALQTQYTEIYKGGGITEDEFKEKVTKLINKPGMTQSIIDFLVLLMETVREFFDAREDNVDGSSEPEAKQQFGGYDIDILQKYGTDPSVMQKLKTYIQNAEALRKNNLTKWEDLQLKKAVERGIQSNPKLAGVESDTEVFMNPAIQQLMRSIQEWEKRLELEQNEQKRAAIEQKIQGIQKQIAFIRKGGATEDAPEEEQESVMGYMTEQVTKDGYGCKQTGKFVDRGFKKPINYAHWLHINS